MKSKRIILLILIISSMLPVIPASSNPLSDEQIRAIEIRQESINENQKTLEDKKSVLEKQRQELNNSQSKVNGINDEITANQNKINELQEKIQALNNEISVITVKLDELNQEISRVEAELQEAMEKYNVIRMTNESRLRELYKNGYESSVIKLVLSSENVVDFFDNILISAKIVTLDKKMLVAVDEAKKAVEDKREEVQKLKDSVISELNGLNARKNDLDKAQKEFEEAKKEAEIRKAQAELEKNAVYQQLSEVEKEYRIQEAIKNNAHNELVAYEKGIFESIYSTAMSTSSKSTLEANINSLEAIKKQLTTEAAIKEISTAINKSKNRLSNWDAAPPDKNSGNNGSGNSLSAKRDKLIAFAYTMIGTPYVWGGESWEEGGFDCSGYVQYVYKQFGYRLSRTTYTQINEGIEVSYSDLQPGDLVFPHDGHIGMYVGNGRYIHAPQTGDVIKVTPITKFWRARRIIY